MTARLGESLGRAVTRLTDEAIRRDLVPIVAAALLVVAVLIGVAASMTVGYHLAQGHQAEELLTVDRRLDSAESKLTTAGQNYLAQCRALLPTRSAVTP